MSNTKIFGVKANIAKWNEKLAIELEEAIATLQTNMSTIHLGFEVLNLVLLVSSMLFSRVFRLYRIKYFMFKRLLLRPTVSSLNHVNGICGKSHPTASQ
jgi:hypothetical protein